MRSGKEQSLDTKILDAVTALNLSGKALKTARLLQTDHEIHELQEYANVVSIVRLGYNDHGPVHMRSVAYNAVIMLGLLRTAGIQTSLEKEECGGFEESLVATLCAAFLHDAGMSVGRQEHELHSAYIVYPILDRVLAEVYAGDMRRRVITRSLALEGISGHMGNRVVHSLEAGVILVADGCDMKKGRARIPMALSDGPKVGDIHKYSANSIEDLAITAGKERPIRIDVHMSSEVGLFQIEEVLLGKIAASPAKGYIELYAVVSGGEEKRYL
jgi:metal-dependent HD superfamily phosphatase/phosphodiesterase